MVALAGSGLVAREAAIACPPTLSARCELFSFKSSRTKTFAKLGWEGSKRRHILPACRSASPLSIICGPRVLAGFRAGGFSLLPFSLGKHSPGGASVYPST